MIPPVSKPLKVLLATPRGFCAGVERAIDIVERSLRIYGPPIYVRHEIVHNRHVVEALREKGAVFVEDLDEIPIGARTIFSAHGVTRLVERRAHHRSLSVIDATCPLVSKVHREGQRYAAQGYAIILIGHREHPEVVGTVGQIDAPVHIVGSGDEARALAIETPEKVAYVTQTTLSVHDTREIIAVLRSKYPAILGPDTRDICYATQNRQNAVLELARTVDTLIVIGANNSSNSNRLREIGADAGISSFLVSNPDTFDLDLLQNARILGLTAGASAPEILVQAMLTRLRSRFHMDVELQDGAAETMTFKLPPELLEAVPVSPKHKPVESVRFAPMREQRPSAVHEPVDNQ